MNQPFQIRVVVEILIAACCGAPCLGQSPTLVPPSAAAAAGTASPELIPPTTQSTTIPIPSLELTATSAASAVSAPVASPAAAPSPPLAPPAPAFDADLVRSGRVAFERNCTECHEGAKSLEKSKDFSTWVATVRRMAEKPDASIPRDEFEPIAAYLTNNRPPAAGSTRAIDQLVDGLTIQGTVSPTWRGGNKELQNGGFFPDAWLGAAWNNGSPISARATACVSCHNDLGGGAIEIVDAAVRLDAMQAFGWKHPRVRLAADFGRFIVPFGAFAAQSNPGVYRTVTRPLMYNMGMRVRDGDLGDPVLPMPYSDEGAAFNLGLPITQAVNFGFDGYVINGLQGNIDGVDFDASRSYSALNSSPSVGGRATLGTDSLRFGASALGGTMSPNGGAGPNGDRLGYRIVGLDATYRYQDLLRFQFEYARRDSDHLRGDPLNPVNAPDRVEGCYAESEVLLLDFLHTSFLFRFDWQRQGARIPAGNGILFAPFSVERLTYGLNFTLSGGSLLMFNYEYWMLPTGFNNLSVLGVRWAATF